MVTASRFARIFLMTVAWATLILLAHQAMAQTNPASSECPVKNVKNISDLFSIEDLPRMRNFRTYMASSYDREGGNYDWGNYERIENDEGVILDVNGPGAITRIWSANPKSVLRIYLDDAEKPVVEEDFRTFMSRAPLGIGRGDSAERLKMQTGKANGFTTYSVIPFQKRCKVTLVEGPKVYYQFNYLIFNKPHEMPTFTPDQKERFRLEYDKIQETLAWNWRETPSAWMHKEGTINLTSGAKMAIFDEEGPLTIRQITFSMKYPDDEKKARHLKEKLQLRGYWDDDLKIPGLEGLRIPSIKSPLAYFFMDFGGLDHYSTALIEKTGEVYAARFPMPVRKRAVLELVNHSFLDTEEISYSIDYETCEEWDPSLAHFKAIYHSEDGAFGIDKGDYREVMLRRNQDGVENYPLLRTWGEGHLVGCCFYVDWLEMPFFRASCESDEAVFIDSDPKRTMWGTGNEDYLNDAWGFHEASGLLSGGINKMDARNSFGYRFHISDAITFSKKLAFTLEHGSSNNCTGLYQSVAYYYVKPTGPNPSIDEIPKREMKRYHDR